MQFADFPDGAGTSPVMTRGNRHGFAPVTSSRAWVSDLNFAPAPHKHDPATEVETKLFANRDHSVEMEAYRQRMLSDCCNLVT
jgi:hypothetical protein